MRKRLLKLHFAGQTYESFVVLYLDAQHRLLASERGLGWLGKFPVFFDSSDQATMLTLANATLHPSGAA
jgi:hypothetical protein